MKSQLHHRRNKKKNIKAKNVQFTGIKNIDASY